MNKTLYGHNSLTEIRGQSSSLVSLDDSTSNIESISRLVFDEKYDQVIFTGCGSSYYIASVVCSLFISKTNIPARFIPCFELEINREAYIKNRRTLIVPFSRDSSTSEVKSVINVCRQIPNVKSLAISCDPRSAEYNDYTVLCTNTEESSIVMTRSFTSMLYAGLLFVNYLAEANMPSTLKVEELDRFISEIENHVKQVVKHTSSFNLAVSLGQGKYYGMAGEASIKIKEMCLIPTEVYYTMEYRHGPISIMNENTLCIMYTSKETEACDFPLLEELNKLHAYTICIGENISDRMLKSCKMSFEVPPQYFPLSILPAQLLGVYWALEKNINPDVPRNLSKAVIL